MPDSLRLISRGGWCALALAAAASVAAAPEPVSPVSAVAPRVCAPVGEWTIPGGGRVAAQDVLTAASRGSVVLLGEVHDNADHHRWQLQSVAGLAALHPKIVLGFEMFPRRVQPALDRWVAGELSEEEFLKSSDWQRVWGFETALYLPLFHFARLNRIPMVALNVERELVRTVGAKGLEAVPPDQREGVSDAAPATEAYVERLLAVYSAHPDKGHASARSDPEFQRFVDAQLIWDRAMAQALAEAVARSPGALVIGIMGASHISNGDGVPYQLQSLGIKRTASLLPWDPNANCAEFSSGLATAVFGFPAARPAPQRPLLGIAVESVPEGVKVLTVNPGSIAETAGLKAGDVLVEVAGSAVKAVGDVRGVVGAMVSGTWLPLKAKRQGETVELTAKFPPATK